MSKVTDAAIYATVSAIIAAIVLTAARNLLGNPIYATDLIIVAAIIWLVNFATQLLLKRTPKIPTG